MPMNYLGESVQEYQQTSLYIIYNWKYKRVCMPSNKTFLSVTSEKPSLYVKYWKQLIYTREGRMEYYSYL